LTPGKVLYLYCPFTHPPKYKYIILAHVGSETICFVINSEINKFTRNRPWLLHGQVELVKTPTDYQFLEHDSYASCDRARNDFSFDDIFNQIDQDMSLIKGELTQATIKEIIENVKQSTTISQSHRELIISSLSKAII